MQGRYVCWEGDRTMMEVVWLRTAVSPPESCVITDDRRAEQLKGARSGMPMGPGALVGSLSFWSLGDPGQLSLALWTITVTWGAVENNPAQSQTN